MDQNQAINLLDSLIAKQQLTRQEHVNAQTAITLLRGMAKQFTELVLEKRKSEEAAKPMGMLPKKNPDAPKAGIDNADKSLA